MTKKLTRPTTRANPASGTWPDARTASNTAIALASANASSCTGVAPASWRWYEQTLIGFHFGASRTVKLTTSAVSRMLGPGGKMWVPRLRYSLRMSFWTVPARSARATPWRSATAM